MLIHMFIQWFDRNPDMSINYSNEHHGTISGNTPAECMAQFRSLARNHDLVKFSPMTIVEIY